MPYWLKDIRIAQKDRAFIDRYIADAEDPDPQPLAPCGYGLVVVDLKGERILDMQGYCHLGVFGHTDFDWPRENVEDDGLLHEPWLAEGRLRPKRYGHWDGSPDVVGEPLKPDVDVQAFMEAEENAAYAARPGGDGPMAFRPVLEIDFSPLTYTRFRHGQVADLKAEMAALGFTFSAEDEAAWAEFMES
jgi:hypothetical protein